MRVVDATVRTEMGLHGRVAGKLVTCVKQFPCRAELVKNGKRHNLKSIMDIMLACCKEGESVHLEFSGESEEEAAQAVEQLFQDNFGEG